MLKNFQKKIEIIGDFQVNEIENDGGILRVKNNDKEYLARNVVISIPAPLIKEIKIPSTYVFLQEVGYSNIYRLLIQTSDKNYLQSVVKYIKNEFIEFTSGFDKQSFVCAISPEFIKSNPQIIENSHDIIALLKKNKQIPDDSKLILIQAWKNALPKIKPGYIKSLSEFQKSNGKKGIYFCGDYTHGPFIEGAVLSGLRVFNLLKNLDNS